MEVLGWRPHKWPYIYSGHSHPNLVRPSELGESARDEPVKRGVAKTRRHGVRVDVLMIAGKKVMFWLLLNVLANRGVTTRGTNLA